MIAPPSKEYAALLAAFEPRIVQIALAVRDIVVAEAPSAFELLYDVPNAVAATFTFTGNPKNSFIHIAAYSTWVTLGFNKGAELPDPGCILRGDGPWIRHIRISSIEDCERVFVRKFVREAIAQAKKAPPVKSPVSAVRPKISKRRAPRTTGGAPGNRGAGSKQV